MVLKSQVGKFSWKTREARKICAGDLETKLSWNFQLGK